MMNLPVPIIFDTDMETDCDDVGALCLLHNLQSVGMCRIAAVVADACSDFIAPSVSVINDWFGRSGIPVGALRLPDYNSNPTFDSYRSATARFQQRFPGRLYNRHLPAETIHEGKTAGDYPGTTEVYRRALASAEDSSVVICVIGFMTALRQLLESPPDDVSPLSGAELLQQKVRRVVAMAVVSPCPGRGDGNFNFRMDLPSSQIVVDQLPVPLHMSAWGTSITTGERLMTEVPVDHPGRRAYELYLRDPMLTPPEWNRSSWDQVAALLAIVGEGPLFSVKEGYTLTTVDDVFEWVPQGNGRADGFVIPNKEKPLESIIEELMIRPPDTDLLRALH
jgi:hypothetical protein